MNNVPLDATTYDKRTTRIALARDGKAYVVYKQGRGPMVGTKPGIEDASFVVQRSDNCGRTWNAPVTVHPTAVVQTFLADPATNNGWGAGANIARATASDAWIAVDPSSGDIYVAHVADASADSSVPGQIYLSRSTDNGMTWAETRVTDGANQSAYPEVAVADNGTIGVLYIDYAVPPTQPNALIRHRFARSFDKGLHWTYQSLQTMDPSTLMVGTGTTTVGWSFDNNPPPLWGDYEGLTAVGNTFYGVFTGASMGRAQAQPDPIFFTEAATGTATLTFKNILVPGNDPGSFDILVDGQLRLAGAQNNAIVGPLQLQSGNHTVSETPSAGTAGSEYSPRFRDACAPTGG
jgi:hypothetical protein